MIKGLGLDLCETARMEKLLQEERFLQRYFSETEAAYIRSRGKGAQQTMAGIFALSFFQKVKLKDPVTVAWLGGLSACVIAIMFYFSHLTAEAIGTTSLFISGIVLFGIIVAFLGKRYRLTKLSWKARRTDSTPP